MREFVTRMGRKGQVTVPAEIRHSLGLNGGESVAFTFERGKVRFQRTNVVERTAGAFKHDGPVLTAGELRGAAEQAIADDVMERMRG